MCVITPADLTPVLVRFVSRTNPPPIGKTAFFGKQIVIPKIVFDFIMKHYPGVFIKFSIREPN